ncbi:MAG TPA: hypothetical protein VD815_09285 [Candidatus Saccharimonadales bacterium]|nr:hypothetical protein [Candidatus Saccharimonadales bacterium]
MTSKLPVLRAVERIIFTEGRLAAEPKIGLDTRLVKKYKYIAWK